jgi:hypothetical protein
LNEDLDSSLPTICKHFGLKINANVGYLKINSLKPNREQIFNDKLLRLVQDKSKRELDLFGYSFEGFSESDVGIPYDGICFDLSDVKYDIYKDKLDYVPISEVNPIGTPINQRSDSCSLTTFWPQYHFQRALSLYNRHNYADAKYEIDLLISKTIRNPSFMEEYHSTRDTDQLLNQTTVRNSF